MAGIKSRTSYSVTHEANSLMFKKTLQQFLKEMISIYFKLPSVYSVSPCIMSAQAWLKFTLKFEYDILKG